MKSKNSRGQIQLGETTAVIIIVIVLLIMGIVFWSKISNSNVKDIKTQSQELSVIELGNTIPEMTELKCSELEYKEVKCIDLYKLQAMSKTIYDRQNCDRTAFNMYNDYFMNSKITITILYPEFDGNKNITIYDANLNGTNTTRALLIPVPVNIKDVVHKKIYYGVMNVEGYYS